MKYPIDINSQNQLFIEFQHIRGTVRVVETEKT